MEKWRRIVGISAKRKPELRPWEVGEPGEDTEALPPSFVVSLLRGRRERRERRRRGPITRRVVSRLPRASAAGAASGGCDVYSPDSLWLSISSHFAENKLFDG